MMKCGMLSWSFRSKTEKSSRPARRRQAGPGLRPGAIQPRRLAAVRRRRNPLLISPSPARGNQLNFRFYRVPQDAKYSARQARSWNPFPAERIPKPQPHLLPHELSCTAWAVTAGENQPQVGFP